MNAEDLRQIGEIMDIRFQKRDEKFDKIDERFDKIDEKFDKIDERFIKVDERFTKIDEKFDKIDENFKRLEQKIDLQNLEMDRRFAEQNCIINGFRTELKNDMTEMRTDFCERMDYKIDGLRNEINGKVDGLDHKINGLGNEVNGKIDDLDHRIDGLRNEVNGKIDGLDHKIDGLKFWIEDRYDPIFQSLKDYLPQAGKTYSDLEMRVDENTVSIKDCYTTSVDHEKRIRKLEKSVQKQDKQKQDKVV